MKPPRTKNPKSRPAPQGQHSEAPAGATDQFEGETHKMMPIELAMLAAQFLPQIDLNPQDPTCWQSERQGIVKPLHPCMTDPDEDLDEDSQFGLACAEAIKRARILLNVASQPLRPPNRALYEAREKWHWEQHDHAHAREHWPEDYALQIKHLPRTSGHTVNEFLGYALKGRSHKTRPRYYAAWHRVHGSQFPFLPPGVTARIEALPTQLHAAAAHLRNFAKDNAGALLAKWAYKDGKRGQAQKKLNEEDRDRKSLIEKSEKTWLTNDPTPKYTAD